MAQINVILWDVDGTLLDFSAAERRALEDCFRSFQMGPCTPELLARYSQINRTYWRRLERGELTKPQVLLGRFEEFFAQEVARRCGAKALVTGECLGQVASQTMDAMLVTGAVVDLPILRPVVGMDKEEIVQIARKIGTFETSILPYEDCCTVFTPRHPRLRPLPGEVEFAEEKLDIQALIQAAVDGIERVQV